MGGGGGGGALILVQKSFLHNDCKPKPEPHEDPLLCSRLLQQEAAIFSQSPSTPPGCDVGYGEREFQRQLSASRLLLCFFWSCVSKFNGTLYFPLSMPYVTTLQYREIFWQNVLYGSDTAAGVLHAAPTPPTVVAQSFLYQRANCCS